MVLYSDIKINWRDIIQWDDNNIKGFFGFKENEYGWLSNFHFCNVTYGGIIYPSSEHAYMSAKSNSPEYKNLLSKENGIISSKEAKEIGRQVRLVENWDEIKGEVMLYCLRSKFNDNLYLKDKLLATGNKYLEETNWYECWT